MPAYLYIHEYAPPVYLKLWSSGRITWFACLCTWLKPILLLIGCILNSEDCFTTSLAPPGYSQSLPGFIRTATLTRQRGLSLVLGKNSVVCRQSERSDVITSLSVRTEGQVKLSHNKLNVQRAVNSNMFCCTETK